MIYEKLPFSYDVQKLKSHLHDHVLGLPRTDQSDAFGGWSVTSSNGDYKDGWAQGHLILEKRKYSDINELSLEFQKASIPLPSEYIVPTEICHGYLKEVINDIAARGFLPRRARIIRLNACSSSAWHQDMPDYAYGVRLHIPIETNAGCFFECDEGVAHLPADGSAYLLRVNRLHRVINNGKDPRYHLVMDAYDTQNLSTHHRVTKSLREKLGIL